MQFIGQPCFKTLLCGGCGANYVDLLVARSSFGLSNSAFNPIRHKLLIIFIIVSSFTHAGVMTLDYFTTKLHTWPGLTIGALNLYATAIVFLIFYPYGKVEAREVE